MTTIKQNTAGEVELQNAYIIPEKEGTKLINTLLEMPIRYSHLINPIIHQLEKGYRGNVKLKINKPINK